MAIFMAVTGVLVLFIAWQLLRVAVYLGMVVLAGAIVVFAGLAALSALAGFAGFWVFYNMGAGVFPASLGGILTGMVLFVLAAKRVKKEIGALFMKNRGNETEKAGKER